jgi:hypothetical protein
MPGWAGCASRCRQCFGIVWYASSVPRTGVFKAKLTPVQSLSLPQCACVARAPEMG